MPRSSKKKENVSRNDPPTTRAIRNSINFSKFFPPTSNTRTNSKTRKTSLNRKSVNYSKFFPPTPLPRKTPIIPTTRKTPITRKPVNYSKFFPPTLKTPVIPPRRTPITPIIPPRKTPITRKPVNHSKFFRPSSPPESSSESSLPLNSYNDSSSPEFTSSSSTLPLEPPNNQGKKWCGKGPLPANYTRVGTSYECFRKGAATNGRLAREDCGDIKDNDPITRIKGIGRQFAERFLADYNIKTVGQLLTRLKRRGETPQTRKDFLKRALRGFQTRRVNRMSFQYVREFLQSKNINVTPMPT